MKKAYLKITLLLAIALMLCLTSCIYKPNDMSLNTSEGNDESFTEESEIDPIFNDPNFVQQKYPIDDFLMNTVNRAGEKKSLSKGKTYTSDFPSDTMNYPDKNNKELTDEQRGLINFMDPAWMGYELKGNNSVSITIDLEEITKDISDIMLSILSWETVGITAPKYVKYSISNDGESYYEIGTVYMAGNNTGEYIEEYVLRLNKSVTARYVRASIPEGSWWLFMDEFAICSYEEQSGELPLQYGELGKKLYTSEKIPKVNIEEFWDDSDNDFNKEINLVKGLSQRVYVPLPLTDRYYTDYKNSPVDSKALTDGIKDTNIWSDNWYKSVHGIERNIIFDLTKTSSVSHVNLGFANSMNSGIYLPRLIEIYLSDNGEDWQLVHKQDEIVGDDNSRVEVKINLNKKYKARFVCIKLGISCFVYCDEIEVIGTKKVDTTSVPLVPTSSFETSFPDDYIYPDDSIYGGAQHILLAPCLKDASSVTGEITKEHWLPYIAYLDKSGNITDTMFDAVMIGEYNTTFEKGKTAENLANYINSIFVKDYNLDALDKVIDEVKEALKLEDYKVSVTVSLPTLNRGFLDMDYNGDGTIENMSTFEGLKTVTDWFMNEVESNFDKAAYKNIELNGYYWMYEAIEYQKPFETELIKYTSDKCHDNGLFLSWIPWNNASGYQEWNKLGFDVTSMQPNYAWYDHTKEVVDEIADECKLLGMSVEIEIHPSAPFSKKYFTNYVEYLKSGVEKGYMEAINFYYQGGVPGEYFVANKDNGAYGRAIYDYTYKYIKGTLALENLEVSDATLYLYCDNSYKGSLKNDKSAYSFYELGVSPIYGEIKLGLNGDFTYTPMQGFEGDDTFTYTVFNGFAEVQNVSVTIKVRKEAK